MGFNIKTSELLIYSKHLGVNFENTVTIGRQKLHGSRYLFQRLFKAYAFNRIDLEKIILEDDRYSENYLKLLGAKHVDSVDASAYEKASIIHDMNLPMSDNHYAKYSAVIDGGSLEHVFNFPVAIKNCMEMVCLGGHFIGIVPANNFLGHGFYQFSPELLYRVFSEENGFKPLKMLLFFNDYYSPIYEVQDPAVVRSRVKLKNNKETYLFFIARRVKILSILDTPPQQSDYTVQWQAGRSQNRDHKIIEVIRKVLPGRLIIALLNYRRTYLNLVSLINPIGDGDSRYFRKIRIR